MQTIHTITTVDTDGNNLTRECACGWVTFATEPEPAHHTPLTQREADHLAEVAKIEDGTIFDEIPAGHSYQLHLRRRLRGGAPNHVVITAIWMGGSQEVLNWPWDADGLAAAQTWCDHHNNIRWARSGSPVQPGDLARHAE